MLLIALFIFLFFYAVILLWFALGFMKTKVFSPLKTHPAMPVTIIICARNEEKKITYCLNSILQQNYPREKVQIIFINDASRDATLHNADGILRRSGFNHKIISNTEQKGKKSSIKNAIQFATHELIITRDADTFTTSKRWLQSISDFYREQHSDMIIAPVAITENTGILWALQAIENNTLAVLACGSAYYKKAFLCNGANLVFTKSIFEKTGAYSSHLSMASGDDVLFLEDVKKVPGAVITYLKSEDAIVKTFPCHSFKELMAQKVRWASKFKVNKNPLNRFLAFTGLVVNAGWIFCLLYAYLQPEDNSASLVFIFLKLLIDFLLLFLASGFIKNRSLTWYSLPVGCVYPIYAFVVGLASVFIKPKWKS